MIARIVVATLMLVAAACARGEPLEFHRVHVPRGRLGDVPLDAGRYVPMTLAEFEAAVARVGGAGATAGPRPLADAVSVVVALDDQGALTGTMSCTVGADVAATSRALEIGAAGSAGMLRIRGATSTGAVAGREALVYGAPDGALALRVPAPGTYDVAFECRPVAAGVASWRLPLVPALATTVELQLPPGVRPVVGGDAARRAVVIAPAAAGAWRVECPPATELPVTVVPRDRQPPRLAAWSDIVLRGGQADAVVTLIPAAPWHAGEITIDIDPVLRVTAVQAGPDGGPLERRPGPDRRTIGVTVPPSLDGGRAPIVLRGVAPATGPAWRLPLVRIPAAAWAGGGMRVSIDRALAVAGIELTECVVVSPADAVSWPSDRPPAGEAGGGAVLHVEPQSPTAEAVVRLERREPTIDVARVTTAEISPATVLGRAACHVRVADGEAFELTARVAPGWIIDAVEPAVFPGLDDPVGLAARRDAPAIDWRVTRSPDGNVLRVGLAVGATPRRSLGLRVTGHRAGLPAGVPFTTADIDMVRFVGESPDTALVDFKLGADTFVEIAGEAVGWLPVQGRLAALVEEGTLRGRIRAGEQVPVRPARVVRRRAPLDAEVRVEVEPRGEVLLETFTFACRQEAGGLESLVVEFSEPIGAGLEWTVVAPAGVSVSARPVTGTDAAQVAAADPAGNATWLVELSPAVEGPLSIRATRSRPFTGPLPLPLAWVTGAIEQRGSVVVSAAGTAPPRVVNRGLREVPSDPSAPGRTDRVVEFAFRERWPASRGVAAEIAPADPGTSAGAWAWSETVSCRCDESGATESESRFDLENLGRDALVLTALPGQRITRVLVDGVALPDIDASTTGGGRRIPLPPDRRRVELVVRTLAEQAPHRWGWRVEPVACRIDAPVLGRDVRLLLPPGLDATTLGAGWRVVDPPQRSWIGRLLGFDAGADVSRTAAEAVQGARIVRLAARPDSGGAGPLIVRRRALASVAVLVALAAAVAVASRSAAGLSGPLAAAALAGVTTLWAAAPFTAVAQGAWWGAACGLGVALVRRFRGPRRAWATTATIAFVAALVPAAAPAAPPEARVFIVPGDDGDTALVPEALFRVLAAAGPAAADVRVLGCEVDANGTGEAPWRIAIDVDADAGGTLVLDQVAGARWLETPDPPAGVLVRIDGGRVRLTLPEAGRRTCVLRVAPALERRGSVATATALVPGAPRSVVRCSDAPVGITCERAPRGGVFLPTPATVGVGETAFDVSGATAVRLVRPIDPRDRLLESVRVAESRNDISWTAAGCEVNAVFDIDAGQELLRSFTVVADDRLEELDGVGPGESALAVEPLGAGRFRITLADAARGRVQVRLGGRMPLVDPVGVFVPPGIWLDGVPGEVRAVRIETAADLEAVLDPPVPAAAGDARLTVQRRRQPPRAAQDLAVTFAPDRIGLELVVQIDADSAALSQIPVEVPPECLVDRVVLQEQAATTGTGPGAVPTEIVWTRPAPDRLVVVVQQPRRGRFRLEVDARIPGPPPNAGRMPVLRALDGGGPLVVGWRGEPPLRVVVAAPAVDDAAGPTQVLDAAAEGPDYRLDALPVPSADGPRDGAPRSPSVSPAGVVHRTEVFLASDGRGRVRGAALIDVTAPRSVLTIRLPAGARLFNLLVDGNSAEVEPRGADAWDVRLHDIGWPRTLLAVFAAEPGTLLSDGAPTRIAPPTLEGLQGSEIVWSLRPPAGYDMRVAPPARPLDEAALAATRQRALEELEAEFANAAAATAGSERERLQALAALRRDGGATPLEAEWQRALGWNDASAPRQGPWIAVATNGPLTVRAVRRADATTPARALATVVLAGIGGVALAAWRRAARRAPPHGGGAETPTD